MNSQFYQKNPILKIEQQYLDQKRKINMQQDQIKLLQKIILNEKNFKVIEEISKQNISSVDDAWKFLYRNQSILIYQQEKDMIELFKTINDVCIESKETLEIIINLQKIGINSKQLLREMDEKDLNELGFNKQMFELKQLPEAFKNFIKQKFNHLKIEESLTKLAEDGIESEVQLLQLSEEIVQLNYLIPKYTFRKWKNEQLSSTDKPINSQSTGQKLLEVKGNQIQNLNRSLQILAQSQSQYPQQQQYQQPKQQVHQQQQQYQLPYIIQTQSSIQQMQQIQISQSNSKQTKDTFKILNKKLQKLISQFKRMDPKNGLEFYQYPIYQKQDLKDVQEYKTLIMIGQTGSGKTTFINFFLNYYLGIQFTDDFRINLINESDLKKHSSQSQTQDVIIYYIKPFNNNPGLRIIDTPGFGDTRGILQDKIIAEKIHQCFLTNVETLTSICFFVQSSNARLTINQNYILSQLLQIFGKDVIENLIFMFTFCDGGAPQAKQALEFKGNGDNNNGCPVADLISNIPQPWFLKFNSSAFTANNKGINGEDAEMTQLFWNIGIKSFESLIEKLRKNQDISLQLTRDVIKQRKTILIVIDHLRLSIYKLLNLIENHKQTYQQIGQIDAAIISSKNFKIKQTKFRIDKIDLKQGQYVTNCINCNYTCHFPCTIPEDNNKSNCASMSNNQCTVCQNKCHWSVHKNNNFRFETTSYEDYIELSELKKSYSQSESQKTQKQQILDGIENQYIFANAECMEQQNQLMIAINKLNLIALQPAVFKHEEEYLELMIQEEKNKKDHGWKERIITLQEMKENWKLVRETCTHTGQVQLTQEFYKEKIKIKKENKGLWSKIFS